MIAKEFAGNKVDVIIYAVEKSLDSNKFNLLQNKQLLFDQYELFTEVALTTKNGFMKADALLVKKNKVTGKIDDVILIENKLSQGTDYTVRQKEGFSKIKNGEVMEINYTSKEGSKGSILPKEQQLQIDPNKTFRFYDGGTDNINKVTIEVVDFSKIK